MQLKDLATAPQLSPIVLDDKEIVEKYGEELTFYVHDKLPIETYTKFANMNASDAAEMYMLVKDLILDEDGSPVIQGDLTLPMDIMNAAIMKVTETLGK